MRSLLAAILVLALLAGCARDHSPTTKTVAAKEAIPFATEGTEVYDQEFVSAWWIVAEDGQRVRVAKGDYDAARVGGEFEAEAWRWE